MRNITNSFNNAYGARNNEGRFSFTYFYFFTGEKGIVKPIQND